MEPNEPPIEGDALDHLWNAAHEMLSAMRGLLEAADEFVETQRSRAATVRNPSEPREGRVHRIDIDVRSDDAAASSDAPPPPRPRPDARSDAS